MIDVPFYIGELLYENDCVIIPGFGGFVGSYSPASIHPVNHTFNPPGKKILFNSKLTRDDGLLLDFIAQSEGLTYNQSAQQVNQFIEELKIKIDINKKVQFGALGVFKKDAVANLEFLPSGEINFLEDAFGLNAFISPAIERKPYHKRKPQFVDRKPASNHENRRKKVLLASGVAIPVLLLFLWIAFGNGFDFQNTQNAGVLDISDNKTSTELTNNLKVNEEDKVVKPIREMNFIEPANDDSENGETDETDASSNSTPMVELPKYYIIGGSFTDAANAEKMVSKLRLLGYDAERAGKSRTGNYVVSYFSSPDKKEALMNLAIIRREHNPSAWILKK